MEVKQYTKVLVSDRNKCPEYRGFYIEDQIREVSLLSPDIPLMERIKAYQVCIVTPLISSIRFHFWNFEYKLTDVLVSPPFIHDFSKGEGEISWCLPTPFAFPVGTTTLISIYADLNLCSLMIPYEEILRCIYNYCYLSLTTIVSYCM